MVTLVGKTLGKYKLVELLGKGGMAEVYKAYHPKLGRSVTIKVLYSHLSEGEDFLARFEREARAVASLRHPHIVQIHDFDVDDERYYMVMEFIDGATLQARLTELSKTGAYMPAGKVLSILRQVGEALDYAHKQKVLHRDIKPSNIMVDTNGNSFLADFGIARMMGTTQFTTTGALIGTPTYMSPEQGKGLELDDASDIYSLGVILYELLTGKVPYTADTPLAVIHQHVNNPLPIPHLLRPDLPPAVEEVIRKALEKDSKDRYQSAMAFCQDLEKALTKDVIARLDTTGTRSAPARTAMPTQLMEEPSLAGRAKMQTEALDTQERLELEKAAPAVTPPASEKPAAKKKEPVEVIQPARKMKPVTPAVERSAAGGISSLLVKIKARPWLIVVLGVVLVAIVVLIISLSGGSSCSDVSSCLALKDQYLQQGDPAGALGALEQAIDKVVPQDHLMYANLWCDRAMLLDQLGRMEEANGSRAICEAWGRGE